jgi:hypothetical protein
MDIIVEQIAGLTCFRKSGGRCCGCVVLILPWPLIQRPRDRFLLSHPNGRLIGDRECPTEGTTVRRCVRRKQESHTSPNASNFATVWPWQAFMLEEFLMNCIKYWRTIARVRGSQDGISEDDRIHKREGSHRPFIIAYGILAYISRRFQGQGGANVVSSVLGRAVPGDQVHRVNKRQFCRSSALTDFRPKQLVMLET